MPPGTRLTSLWCHALGRCVTPPPRRPNTLGNVLYERHEPLALEWKRNVRENGAL